MAKRWVMTGKYKHFFFVLSREDLSNGVDESVIENLLSRKHKTGIHQDGAQKAVNCILKIAT